MTFWDDVHNDVDFIFEDTGVEVLYDPEVGDPKTILAFIEHGGVLDDKNWRMAVETEAVVMIKQADVSQPAYKDKITIDGNTWTVVGVHGPNAGIWKLEIRKELRPTFKEPL